MPLHANFKSQFNLDTSGVAGFFGGDEAFAAMNSVHFTPLRRWIGWYNSPGSYVVAKRYGTLPNSTFWDGLFPGPATNPTELLQLNNKNGLPYIGVYSGIQTPAAGYLTYLLSLRYKVNLLDPNLGGTKLSAGDKLPQNVLSTKGASVTIVEMKDFDNKKWPTYPHVPKAFFKTLPLKGVLVSTLAIAYCAAASVLAALYEDWFSCSMIILGIVANGTASIFLGAGSITLEFDSPPEGSPPDDGVLLDGKDIIILHGSARVLNGILNSKYRLVYENDPHHRVIGVCSIILLAQFLLQLFIIPQGALVGQILFLSTLLASWICNGYFASFNYDEIKTDTLFKLIGEPVLHHSVVFQRRSSAVAYTMFYFRRLQDPKGPINALLPDNTPIWHLWKEYICFCVVYDRQPTDFIQAHRRAGIVGTPQPSGDKDEEAAIARLERLERALGLPDKRFLEKLLREADVERTRAVSARDYSAFQPTSNLHMNNLHMYGPGVPPPPDYGGVSVQNMHHTRSHRVDELTPHHARYPRRSSPVRAAHSDLLSTPVRPPPLSTFNSDHSHGMPQENRSSRPRMTSSIIHSGPPPPPPVPDVYPQSAAFNSRPPDVFPSGPFPQIDAYPQATAVDHSPLNERHQWGEDHPTSAHYLSAPGDPMLSPDRLLQPVYVAGHRDNEPRWDHQPFHQNPVYRSPTTNRAPSR